MTYLSSPIFGIFFTGLDEDQPKKTNQEEQGCKQKQYPSVSSSFELVQNHKYRSRILMNTICIYILRYRHMQSQLCIDVRAHSEECVLVPLIPFSSIFAWWISLKPTKTPHLGLSENWVTPKVDGLLYHPFPLQIASTNLSHVYHFQLSRWMP